MNLKRCVVRDIGENNETRNLITIGSWSTRGVHQNPSCSDAPALIATMGVS